MNEEVNFNELLNRGDEIIQKLIETGGRSWCLSIPARPNEDPDLVLSKIISEARKERLSHEETKAQSQNAVRSSILWQKNYEDIKAKLEALENAIKEAKEFYTKEMEIAFQKCDFDWRDFCMAAISVINDIENS